MSARKQKPPAGKSKQPEASGFKPDWSPKLECFTRLSADGRYVIHKTIITSIKPIRYMEKVLEGKTSGTRNAPAATNDFKIENKGQ